MDITWYDYGNDLRQMGCYNPIAAMAAMFFFGPLTSGTAPTSMAKLCKRSDSSHSMTVGYDLFRSVCCPTEECVLKSKLTVAK